jgi:hypothetical protein
VFVRWLPLGKERAVVEAQTGGLLGDIDIDCRAGERAATISASCPASITPLPLLESADETLLVRRSIFKLGRQYWLKLLPGSTPIGTCRQASGEEKRL